MMRDPEETRKDREKIVWIMIAFTFVWLAAINIAEAHAIWPDLPVESAGIVE